MTDELTEFFGEPYSKTVETIQSESDPFENHVVGINPLQAQIDAAPKQIKEYKQTITGKGFEKFIQTSVIKYQNDLVSIDRFYDSERNRNICDFLVQRGNKTGWIEAKTTGTSMEFHRPVNDPVKSKFKQQPLLAEKSRRCKRLGNRHNNMIGALIEFKRKGVPFEYWWCDIDDILWLESNLNKKSFNTKDLERMYIARAELNSFPVRLYKPKGAHKNYLDIALMVEGNEIDPDTVQLES